MVGSNFMKWAKNVFNAYIQARKIMLLNSFVNYHWRCLNSGVIAFHICIYLNCDNIKVLIWASRMQHLCVVFVARCSNSLCLCHLITIFASPFWMLHLVNNLCKNGQVSLQTFPINLYQRWIFNVNYFCPNDSCDNFLKFWKHILHLIIWLHNKPRNLIKLCHRPKTSLSFTTNFIQPCNKPHSALQ